MTAGIVRETPCVGNLGEVSKCVDGRNLAARNSHVIREKRSLSVQGRTPGHWPGASVTGGVSGAGGREAAVGAGRGTSPGAWTIP